MPTFRKFAFPSQKVAEQLLQSLQPLDNAVPLGTIDGLVCYDILFQDTPSAAFTPYIVWPTPCGVHSFLGWDEQYTADYQEFATPSTK